MARSRISAHKIFLLGAHKKQVAAILSDYFEESSDFESFLNITQNAVYFYMLYLDREVESTQFAKLDYLMLCVKNEDEIKQLIKLSQTFKYHDTNITPKIIIVKKYDLALKDKDIKNCFYTIDLEFSPDQLNAKQIVLDKLDSIVLGKYENTEYFQYRKIVKMDRENKRSKDSWLWAQPSDEKSAKKEMDMIPLTSLYRYRK